MESEERRAATRHVVPDDLEAAVNDVKVEILDLSLVGLKVQHMDRFPLLSPQLTMRWRKQQVVVPVRVMRSQIVGQKNSKLVYETALQILSGDSTADAFLASVVKDPAASPVPPAPPSPPQPAASFDDTWTRQVRFVADELDEDLPYAQYRLTPSGWQKEYVASPEQPQDGFTIGRERTDFPELQRTYEAADPDTRRMIQIALESQAQLV
ncbi:MAG: hypothetical protein WA208_20390 [Thermoanaerobaculia bacterium]